MYSQPQSSPQTVSPSPSGSAPAATPKRIINKIPLDFNKLKQAGLDRQLSEALIKQNKCAKKIASATTTTTTTSTSTSASVSAVALPPEQPPVTSVQPHRDRQSAPMSVWKKMPSNIVAVDDQSLQIKALLKHKLLNKITQSSGASQTASAKTPVSDVNSPSSSVSFTVHIPKADVTVRSKSPLLLNSINQLPKHRARCGRQDEPPTVTKAAGQPPKRPKETPRITQESPPLIVLENKVLAPNEKIDLRGLRLPKIQSVNETPVEPSGKEINNPYEKFKLSPDKISIDTKGIKSKLQAPRSAVGAKKVILNANKLKMPREKLVELAKEIQKQAMQKANQSSSADQKLITKPKEELPTLSSRKTSISTTKVHASRSLQAPIAVVSENAKVIAVTQGAIETQQAKVALTAASPIAAADTKAQKRRVPEEHSVEADSGKTSVSKVPIGNPELNSSLIVPVETPKTSTSSISQVAVSSPETAEKSSTTSTATTDASNDILSAVDFIAQLTASNAIDPTTYLELSPEELNLSQKFGSSEFDFQSSTSAVETKKNNEELPIGKILQIQDMDILHATLSVDEDRPNVLCISPNAIKLENSMEVNSNEDRHVGVVIKDTNKSSTNSDPLKESEKLLHLLKPPTLLLTPPQDSTEKLINPENSKQDNANSTQKAEGKSSVAQIPFRPKKGKINLVQRNKRGNAVKANEIKNEEPVSLSDNQTNVPNNPEEQDTKEPKEEQSKILERNAEEPKTELDKKTHNPIKETEEKNPDILRASKNETEEIMKIPDKETKERIKFTKERDLSQLYYPPKIPRKKECMISNNHNELSVSSPSPPSVCLLDVLSQKQPPPQGEAIVPFRPEVKNSSFEDTPSASTSGIQNLLNHLAAENVVIPKKETKPEEAAKVPRKKLVKTRPVLSAKRPSKSAAIKSDAMHPRKRALLAENKSQEPHRTTTPSTSDDDAASFRGFDNEAPCHKRAKDIETDISDDATPDYDETEDDHQHEDAPFVKKPRTESKNIMEKTVKLVETADEDKEDLELKKTEAMSISSTEIRKDSSNSVQLNSLPVTSTVGEGSPLINETSASATVATVEIPVKKCEEVISTDASDLNNPLDTSGEQVLVASDDVASEMPDIAIKTGGCAPKNSSSDTQEIASQLTAVPVNTPIDISVEENSLQAENFAVEMPVVANKKRGRIVKKISKDVQEIVTSSSAEPVINNSAELISVHADGVAVAIPSIAKKKQYRASKNTSKGSRETAAPSIKPIDTSVEQSSVQPKDVAVEMPNIAKKKRGRASKEVKEEEKVINTPVVATPQSNPLDISMEKIAVQSEDITMENPCSSKKKRTRAIKKSVKCTKETSSSDVASVSKPLDTSVEKTTDEQSTSIENRQSNQTESEKPIEEKLVPVLAKRRGKRQSKSKGEKTESNSCEVLKEVEQPLITGTKRKRPSSTPNDTATPKEPVEKTKKRAGRPSKSNITPSATTATSNSVSKVVPDAAITLTPVSMTTPTPKKRGRKPKNLELLLEGSLEKRLKTENDGEQSSKSGPDHWPHVPDFNLRLLLIRKREQLESEEELREEGRGQGALQCGLCLVRCDDSSWTLHLGEHYGVGWQRDNCPVVTTRNGLLTMMITYLKAGHGNKRLTCRLCDRKLASGLGMLLHLEGCGSKPARIECEFCKHSYSRLSFSQHTRFCYKRFQCNGELDTSGTSAVEADQPNTTVFSNAGRTKRKSTIKAETKLQKIAEQLEQPNANETIENKDFEGDSSDYDITADKESSEEYQSDGADSNEDAPQTEDECDSKSSSSHVKSKESKSSAANPFKPCKQNKLIILYVGKNFAKDMLYTHLLPRFEKLSTDEACNILPSNKSLSMRYDYGNVKNNDWKQFTPLEGLSEENEYLCHLGNPIKELSWVPLPPTVNTQYLLCSLRHKVHGYARQINDKMTNALLLLLKCSLSSADNGKKWPPQISLHYGIRVSQGPVHSFAFMPSGGYNEATNRLGLLAVGSASGVIIYALPLELSEEKEKQQNEVIELQGLITLILDIDNPRYDPCTKICWSQSSGHNMLVTGYASGNVAFWDIADEQGINSLELNNQRHILPANFFYFGERNIQYLELHYDLTGPHWLAVGSAVRKLFVYDISNWSKPLPMIGDTIHNFHMGYVYWPPLWESFVVGSAELNKSHYARIIMFNSSGINYSQSTLDMLPSSIRSIHFNSEQLASVAVTDNGDIVFLNTFEFNMDSSLKRRTTNIRSVCKTEVNYLNSDPEPKSVSPDTFKQDYGLLLKPIANVPNNKKSEFLNPKVQPSYDLKTLMRLNCVRWNWNTPARNWVAIGAEHGLLRIINFKSDKHF
ncbi:hypothetical protein KR222_011603 [Zaprionus bogoriensis]|nr:hypothetical protein KR222_011603 [Zaprionus bogoriensis]